MLVTIIEYSKDRNIHSCEYGMKKNNNTVYIHVITQKQNYAVQWTYV